MPTTVSSVCVFRDITTIMAEQLTHQLPMSEGVFTFRVQQTENGSLVASLHKEAGNYTPASGGYYNRYRHRYHHNALPALYQTETSTLPSLLPVPRQQSGAVQRTRNPRK